jgi:hypothetical protein
VIRHARLDKWLVGLREPIVRSLYGLAEDSDANVVPVTLRADLGWGNEIVYRGFHRCAA